MSGDVYYSGLDDLRLGVNLVQTLSQIRILGYSLENNNQFVESLMH